MDLSAESIMRQLHILYAQLGSPTESLEDEGCAECFLFEFIKELKTEFWLR